MRNSDREFAFSYKEMQNVTRRKASPLGEKQNPNTKITFPSRKCGFPIGKWHFRGGKAELRKGNRFFQMRKRQFLTRKSIFRLENVKSQRARSNRHPFKKICNILSVSSVYISEGL